jgi:acylphosphatase
MAAVRAFVTGRVQGVGFRAFVLREARALGLAGYVRNLRDGRVEALFAGPPDAVEAALAACRRGPPGARVESLEIAPAPDGEAPDMFELRRDH